MPLRIFVGWDRREHAAWQVCKKSIERRASVPVYVVPIMRRTLKAAKVYWRAEDPLASTEFTYTRFLVPWLAAYQGWALYCDCDFLFLDDVAKLFEFSLDCYGVMCVQHDHRPTNTTKMGGQVQTVYPRKNWSSLMLFNCGAPEVRHLTPWAVNNKSPAWLHRFEWLDDVMIGGLPEKWNWLAGHSPTTEQGVVWADRLRAHQRPSAIHLTDGGPWLDACQDVPFADDWRRERDAGAIDVTHARRLHDGHQIPLAAPTG